MSDTQRETGTVKWFNGQKGFGFIERANGEDIFVHISDLPETDKNLNEGQQVTFEVGQGPKGPNAIKVQTA